MRGRGCKSGRLDSVFPSLTLVWGIEQNNIPVGAFEDRLETGKTRLWR